jgi:membrane associated rhomboid family serine protease
MSSQRASRLTQAVQFSATAICGLYALRWLEQVWRLPLTHYGIIPRTWRGLVGIVVAPLLHANWSHLTANALPLLVLFILLLADRQYYPWRTLGLIWIVGGAGTWLIGRPHTIHIGASSLIFGLVVYLIAAGFLMGKWRPALIAVLVALLFGSALYGVLPRSGPISWEGHLCGAAAGLWAARLNHLRGRTSNAP